MDLFVSLPMLCEGTRGNLPQVMRFRSSIGQMLRDPPMRALGVLDAWHWAFVFSSIECEHVT